MKKSLLIAVAALFVALGANAQAKHFAKMPEQKGLAKNVVQKSGIETRVSSKISKLTSSFVAKAPKKAVSDIEGTYIMDGFDSANEFATPGSFDIVAEEGTITLDLYDEPIEFSYNVKLVDFDYKGFVVYGDYDEESETILIPVQVAAQTTKELGFPTEYGRVALGGATSFVAGQGFSYFLPIELSFTDYGLEFVGLTDDDRAITGVCTFLPDYTPTSADDSDLFKVDFDCEVFPANSVMSCRSSISFVRTDGGSTGYGDAEYFAAVEDLGTQLLVHNFLGLTTIMIQKNSDGTLSVLKDQRCMSDNYDEDPPYEYMRLVAIDFKPGKDSQGKDVTYLVRNWDRDVLTGFGSADGDRQFISFYKTEHREAWTDDEGTHEEGDYYLDEPPYYFTIASGGDDEGLAYTFGGYCYGLSMMVVDSNVEIPTGIEYINVIPENTKSTTLYDLQGRVVDGSYKGIVISNGKKMVVK